MHYVKVIYDSILTPKRLEGAKAARTFKSRKLSEVILQVSDEVYVSILQDDYLPVANAFRDHHKYTSSCVIDYGQIDSIEMIEEDGITFPFTEDETVVWPAYKLLEVEDSSDIDWYKVQLTNHDWFYSYSDCGRTYRNGVTSACRVNTLRASIDPDYAIWDTIVPKEFKHKKD